MIRQLLGVIPPNIQAMRNFIAWKPVWSTQKNKWEKYPLDQFGKVSSAHDPAGLLTLLEAIVLAESLGDKVGVGFVFTPGCNSWFVDVDHAFIGGKWSDQAINVLNRFPGAYVETSFSEDGFHIIGTGTPPPHSCKNIELGFELYHEGRFVALTGTHARGDWNADFSAQLPQLVEEYFPPRAEAEREDWTTEPAEGYAGPEDDEPLIQRLLATKPFDEVTFRDLWERNEDRLGAKWPDDHAGRPFNESAADFSLACRLMWWTGRNCERTLSLMNQSGLHRDKWESRPEYLESTIMRAFAGTPTYWGSDQEQVEEVHDNDAPEVRSGPNFYAGQDMVNYFSGCVYVKDQNEIFRNGEFYTKLQFNNCFTRGNLFYGGESGGKDVWHKEAWKAYLDNSQITPVEVASTVFQPKCAPGQVITTGARRYVNTYWPRPIAMKEGDVSPFLEYMRRIIPDDYERSCVINYMACVAQNPGDRLRYMVGLQGVEGNGKSLILTCLIKAMPQEYVHLCSGESITSKFNGFLYQNLLIGLDDLPRIPEGPMWDAIKRMCGGAALHGIERKGQDQITTEICANFFFTTNHKDVIPKTESERRILLIFCAQDKKADLIKTGLTPEYLRDFAEWLHADGFEIVAHYLHNLVIPADQDPRNMSSAPVTKSTAQAKLVSKSDFERTIMECIEEDHIGFRGGWVSSMAIDRLIDRKHLKVHFTKRHEALTNLGYVRHPALREGRVNNHVEIDGGKPRLYILPNSPHAELTGSSVIAGQYTTDQETESKVCPFKDAPPIQ